MASKALPSPEVLRQLLRYEPDTGKLFWLPRDRAFFGCQRSYAVWNARYSGKESLTADDQHGYRVGNVLGRTQKAHRVAWAIQTGKWPSEHIDHVNCDGADNRWANLREATNQQNGFNRRANKNSKSGIKGVCWIARRKKWIAQISANGEGRSLGVFDTAEEATAAYAVANAQIHGEFGRLG